MPHLNNKDMQAQAQALGFTYSRKGCPCNGTPLIYTQQVGGTLYTLTLWERRGTWRLQAKGCVLATGGIDNLETKIKAIWDL